jgi:ribosomal protein L37E
MTCWRCNSRFVPHPATGNCLLCGYGSDENLEKLIRAKKAIHDLIERNIKSDGGDRDYKVKRKWSTKE